MRGKEADQKKEEPTDDEPGNLAGTCVGKRPKTLINIGFFV